MLPGVFSCSDGGVIASLRGPLSVGWICINSPRVGAEELLARVKNTPPSESVCMHESELLIKYSVMSE